MKYSFVYNSKQIHGIVRYHITTTGHSRALGRWRPEDLKLEAIVACVVRSVSEAKATIDRMNSHPAHALSLLTDSPSQCDTPLL